MSNLYSQSKSLRIDSFQSVHFIPILTAHVYRPQSGLIACWLTARSQNHTEIESRRRVKSSVDRYLNCSTNNNEDLWILPSVHQFTETLLKEVAQIYLLSHIIANEMCCEVTSHQTFQGKFLDSNVYLLRFSLIRTFWAGKFNFE